VSLEAEPPTSMNGNAAIEAIGISRRYGDMAAVDDVSFSVKKGEFFAILGPNGAGKSTLVHMLTTILPPTTGTGTVMGDDIVKKPGAVRWKLGMVFQDPAVDERLTAIENLEIHAVLYGIPRHQRKQLIEDAIQWAQLTDARKRRVATFSGGMKRRLELARALMHDPSVLFLDEPTIGLDPQGRRNLWDRIDGLRQQGMTVFMNTHNLPEAQACDRVGILDRGKLIEIGSPAELIAKHGNKERADLEDVFINLTGRQLRDEVATARDRLVSFAKRGGEHTR
jgi:ABC-2 type transport system ATP-binding protein